MDMARLEIEEFFVADILQHQRLGTVANHDEIAVTDFRLTHEGLRGAAAITPGSRTKETPNGPF